MVCVFECNFPLELGIVVLCPSQLVQMAVQQYLSEKLVLEAQLMNVSQDGENPLISSNNEGDTQLDVSDEANSGGSLDGAVSVDSEGENPATEEDNRVPRTSSVVEGGEGEEDTTENKEGQAVTTEQPTSEDLPPYLSEVYTCNTLLQSA